MHRRHDDTATVICSILERSAEEAARGVAAAPAACGLVEIRADHLRADAISSLVRNAERSVLVTVRPRRLGGEFDGSE